MNGFRILGFNSFPLMYIVLKRYKVLAFDHKSSHVLKKLIVCVGTYEWAK